MKKRALRKCMSGFIAMMLVLSCVTPVTFAAYTDEDNTPVLFEEDFSAYEPSGATIDAEELNRLSGGDITGSENFNYVLNEDGSMTFYQPVTGDSVEEGKETTLTGNVNFDFSRTIEYDDFASDVVLNIDIKKEAVYKADESGSLTEATGSDSEIQRNLSFYYTEEDGTRTAVKVFEFDSLCNFGRATSTWPFYGTAQSTAPVTKNGYYSLKVVLSKESVNVNGSNNTAANGGSGPFYDFSWAARVYDANNDDALLGMHRYLKEADADNSSYKYLPGVSGFSLGCYMSNKKVRTNELHYTVKNPVVKIDGFEAVMSENNSIAVGATEVKVNFNRNVDMTTVDDNITFTDEKGNNLVQGAATEGSAVTLTISPAEFGGKYRLNILSGLKSDSAGPESVFPASFEYTAAVENQSNIIFEEDFSKWQAEDGKVLTYTDLAELSGGKITSETAQTFVLSGDALTMQRKYLAGSASTSASLKIAQQKLSEIKDAVVFETDIKAAKADIYEDGTYRPYTDGDTLSGSSNRWFQIKGCKADGTELARDLFGIKTDGTFMKPSDSKNTYKVGSVKTGAVNGEGYYSLKTVIEAENVTVGSEQYAWKVTVYDKNNNGDVLHTFYYTADELSGVTGITFNIYEDAAARNASIYSRWTIKNPVIYIDGLMLVQSDDKKINLREDALTVEFTKAVDGTTAEKNILLLDKNGKNVIDACRIDGNKAVLTLKDTVIGETYTLYILGGLKSTDGGYAYTSAAEYTAVYEEKSSVLFEEDFAEWETSVNPFGSAELSNLSDGRMTGTADGGTPDFSLNEDGSLSVYYAYDAATTGGRSVRTYMAFSEGMTCSDFTDDVVITMDIKKETYKKAVTDGEGNVTFEDAEAAGGEREFGFYYTDDEGNKKNKGLFVIGNDGKFTYFKDEAWNRYGSDGKVSAVTNSDGYWQFKIVISEGDFPATAKHIGEELTYSWKAEVYDLNGENTPVYTHYYFGEENSRGYMPKIDGMYIANYQPKANLISGETRFTVKNPKAETARVVSIAPEDTIIDTAAGSLDIEFTGAVKADTINTITLTGSDGNNVITRAEADGSTVTVYFGELNAGEKYTLEINPGLKSAKGGDVGIASYTYTAAANKPMVNIDFTGLENGSYTAESVSDIHLQISGFGSGNGKPSFTLTDGALTMNAGYGDDSSYSSLSSQTEGIAVALPQTVSEGAIAAELKIKAGEDSAVSSTCQYYRAIKFGGSAIKITSEGTQLSRVTASSFTTANGSYASPEFITDDECISLRLVASRADTEDCWTVAVYDMNDSGTDDPKVVAKGSADDIDKITIELYRNEAGRKSTEGKPNVTAPITLKSASVYKTDGAAAALCGAAGGSKPCSLTIDAETNTVTWSGTVYSRSAAGGRNRMYLAAYDENGVLLSVKTAELNGFDTNAVLTVENGTVDSAVLYVWDAGMKPLAAVKN